MNKETITAKQTVNLGQVSFINCLPFNYALKKYLENEENKFEFKCTAAPPSVLNKKLYHKELDLAPISSYEYLLHQNNYKLVPEYSISSNSSVDSVLFLSKVELSKLRTVYLTNKSASSVALLKVLLNKKYGLKNLEYKVVENLIEVEEENKLLIGDDALIEKQSKYQLTLDLGKEWFEFTGLPMVFGVWAYNKDFEYNNDLNKLFQELKQDGLNKYFPDVVIESYIKSGLPKETITKYFDNLNFDFTEKHKESLDLFESYIKELGLF